MTRLPIFQREKSGGINFSHSKNNIHQWYLFSFLLMIILIFILLMLRLFQLTIVKGDYYLRLSENNRIKEIIIEAERGTILDRKGITVSYNTLPDIKTNLPRLKSDRIYLSSETNSHLVGYRQLADANDIKNDNCLNKLKLGDKVGKKGIEKIYDCDLRGKAGKKLIEVDAKGKEIKTLTVIPPTAGKNIQLAFDSELQKKAYELIKDKKGAVVGLKPETGEVLILVSSPGFNSQDFENENTVIVNQYLFDKEKPLFNRATEGVYPPGSIFKLIVATAALEEKKINDKTMFEDTGTITAGPLTFGNWYFLQYGKTEGMIDIIKGIQRSNDIFFYKIGEAVGVDKIKIWANKFGFGKATSIGLNESEGTVPSSFWKEEILKDRWYLGDTYNLAIGQGYLLVTPLQIAQATAVLANNGILCQPQLLKLAVDDKPVCHLLSISQKTLDLVREGMKAACAPGGTGWPFFDYKPAVACKTGTAESLTKETNPHAWFTVYAPATFDVAPQGKPEIVLTVLLEESGQGSDIAGPIAKEILKMYFERKE